VPSVRDRRLGADFEKVQALTRNSGGSLRIEVAAGRPPDAYVLMFRCRGIAGRTTTGKAQYRDVHTVEITLPAAYPAQAPYVRFREPMFHPHVFAGTNVVCIGGWTISEQLDQLVLSLGALIQYDPQYINFDSPANRVALDWVRGNMELFPLDSTTFRGPEKSAVAIEWRDLQ
jgi:hypothetical protein